MATLREMMSDNGYESNDDYSYHVRCLLSNRTGAIRCLNIDGTPGRRKTAFANALATSLQYRHVLYHDFTLPESVTKKLQAAVDEEPKQTDKSSQVSSFDRVMIDACAYSEGDGTILILDQLQAAPFANHIRIYKFVRSHQWLAANTEFYANKNKLLIFLISEQPLYHSLQKHSFRVWVSDTSLGDKLYRAEDFRLQRNAQPVVDALRLLFVQIGVMPTTSEFAHILDDVQLNVRTAEELINSIFGWTEGISLEVLRAREIRNNLDQTMEAIEAYIGVDVVELDFANFSVPE
jgi:hypothetical protein